MAGFASMIPLANTHALVVGIASYQHVNPLPAAVLRDVQDVYSLLVDPASCGYLGENVTLLLDDSATQVNLRMALADLARSSDADATVLIYFSCHGAQLRSGPYAGEYLLPADASLLSEQILAETTLSGTELTQALHAIPARKLVIIFDCCHAGGLGQPKQASHVVIKTGLPESYYDVLRTGRGRVILASSRSDEASWIRPGATNSLFTHHLLAGLRGGIASDDGLIRILHLFEYVQPRVTVEQPNQHPILKAEVEDNFPIALYLGGKKGLVPITTDGYRYDVYLSWVRAPLDTDWVRNRLLPRFQAAGLRVVMSGRVEEPGVALVVGIQRAVEQSRRTAVLLSRSYLEAGWAEYENALSQFLSVEDRLARTIPVVVDKDLVDAEGYVDKQVSSRLRSLIPFNLTDPLFGEQDLDRLVQFLGTPLR